MYYRCTNGPTNPNSNDLVKMQGQINKAFILNYLNLPELSYYPKTPLSDLAKLKMAGHA